MHTKTFDNRQRLSETNLWVESLKLARRGIPVFPCGPDKRPLTPNGFKDASTNPDIVHEWWTAHPNALTRGIARATIRSIISESKDADDGLDIPNCLRRDRAVSS